MAEIKLYLGTIKVINPDQHYLIGFNHDEQLARSFTYQHLSLDSNNLTVDLNVGVGPGQVIYGAADASGILTLSSTSSGTKGIIYLGAAGGSAYDETNNFLGVGTGAPTAKMHLVNNSIGISPSNAYGHYLQNTTAATVGLNQSSPSITMEGRGWKTNATAASQPVAFRQYILPVTGAISPSFSYLAQASINGGAYATLYTLSSGGDFRFINGSATTPTLGDSTGAFGMFFTSSSVGFGGGGTSRWTISTTALAPTGSGMSILRNQGTDGLLFAPTGDTNTGVGAPGSDVLNLITGGVKALVCDASQRVGIGVFSGSITAALHVKASTTATASMRIDAGTSPTSPNEGDMWSDSTQKAMIAFSDGIKQARPGVIFTQTADQTVTNTVTETTILGTGVGTKTLPANFFVAGKTIRLRVGGIYSTPALATPSLIIKVKYGSTVVATVTTTALLSGATNLAFDGEVLITCRTTGGSGTVMVHGDIEYATGVAGTIAVDPLNNAGATTTIDTTASNALDVTVQWDTNTTSRIAKSTVCTIEVLN